MLHPLPHFVSPFRSVIRRRAAGLTELLVCIALIGILVALLYPALQRVSDQKQTLRCISNLRTIHMAIQAHLADHDQLFPTLPPDGPLAWYAPLFTGGYLPRPSNVTPKTRMDKSAPTLCPANPTPRDKSNAAWTNYGINSNLYSYQGLGKTPSNIPKRATSINSTKALMRDCWDEVENTTWYYASSGGSKSSPLHGGTRLNVLFLDGHVKSPDVSSRVVDANGDLGELRKDWFIIP